MLKLDTEIGMTYYQHICGKELKHYSCFSNFVIDLFLVFRVVSMVSFLYIVRCLGH